MFRRAKLWLDAVPDEVMTAAIDGERLAGRYSARTEHTIVVPTAPR